MSLVQPFVPPVDNSPKGPSRPPAAKLPENLTSKLRDLKPGKMLFVDANGKLHQEKDEMLANNIPPLVSFRKEIDGTYRVYTGLPPRNSTHCGSGVIPIDSELNQFPDMERPVVLNSGDWIALTAKLPVYIPTFRNPNPSTAADKLAELMASAQVGDTLVLGRSKVPQCPAEVSRAHITVKIIERKELSASKISLRIVVLPGIEGTQAIYEVKPSGEPERIIGARDIPEGGTIQIGEGGEQFHLPYPKGSFGEASVMYRRSVADGDPEANQSVMSVFGPAALKKAQFIALKNFVVPALSMIREGRYTEALAHLQSESKELVAAGYTLSENHYIVLKGLSEEKVKENLLEVASDSSFDSDKKRVYPSVGILAPGLRPSNEREEKLLAVWERNIALIYAGEYIHALQDMRGGAISDYTPLFGGKEMVDHEADVALVFKRHGIDLSDGLFTGRYPARETAIDRVTGYQSKQDELAFKRSLLEAPLDTPVDVLPEIIVKRTVDGYLVTRRDDLSGARYLTSHDRVRTLRTPVVLQGGDQLFVGNRTFTLPGFEESA